MSDSQGHAGRQLHGKRLAPAGLLALLIVIAVAGPSGAQPVLPVGPDERCAVEGPAREGLYNGTNPDRQPKAYNPFRVTRYPCARPAESRVVVMRTDGLELIEGGQFLRFIPLAGGAMAFEQIAQAIDDPAWMAEVEPGVFEVGAAVVQTPGTTVLVAAPAVRTLRLLDLPDLFLGGQGAVARFEGVAVTSWDRQRGGPDENLDDGRPFVLYEEGGRLDVVGSSMSYLGSDRSGGAYGVSWRQGGITGEILDSTFDHNFFGVYTFEAADMVFRGNVFRDNLLYGFDPHDDTTGLVVEDNQAYGNGSHGFIISRHVIDSSIRNNYAHHNRGSGFVVDFESVRNLVEDNLSEDNTGDGIVLLGSGDNVVADNVVRRNRVGIRVHHLGSQGNEIRDNLLEANGDGLQAYGGASDLTITGNRVLDTTGTAMLLDAPRSAVRGGEIQGAARGLAIHTATRISDLQVSGVQEGVVVTPTGIAELTGVGVRASQNALRVDGEGLVEVHDSNLVPSPAGEVLSDGSDGSDGSDDLWLPLIGIGAVTLAVLLEVLRWVRERRDLPSPAPAEVWNRA